MGSGRRTITIYFTVFAGLLLTGLIVFAPFPRWVWAALAAVAGAALLIVRYLGRGTHATSPVEPTYFLPPPVENREHQVVDVALPSQEEDYDFLFSATVRWSPLGGVTGKAGANLGGLAVDAILERAMAITRNRPPGRASLVQHELNGALGTMQPDAAERVRAMAESVALTLSDHDRQRLDKLAEIRKQKAVWEHERTYEQSRREYLGKDVLKDPGSAVVWWLSRNDDQVEKVVQDLGILAQVSSAANNQEVPEHFRHLTQWPSSPRPADDGEPDTSGLRRDSSAVDLFAAFLQSADFPDGDPQRALFSRQVAECLTKYGKQDVADDLIRRFDAPDDFMPDDEAPASGRPSEGPPIDDLG
ncbi:hypothetical protein HS041_14695 [Planomonospora sp. ID67723]|uniref:hypothetical protein n=1 Tax=Planomonospora sp. ID67723 TaxID=2738134 RepID=UPI0018C3C0A0|nr:hypothetical protein [Planomonospora sp. ID67723]MBG0829019.1 hypothetical protein [Planomonospora sp. ID67723]